MSRMIVRSAALMGTVAALAFALPLVAEEEMDHSTHGAMMTGDVGPASLAFMAVNDKMHANMAIAFSGNADVDFIRGMIPHHQGAVEMAQVVLEHGSDPEVRKLAEAIIAAQEAEIQWMQDWLAKNGG